MTLRSADDVPDETAVQSSPAPTPSAVPRAEGASRRSLSPQLEAFLFDRFSTNLEDRYTGRRI